MSRLRAPFVSALLLLLGGCAGLPPVTAPVAFHEAFHLAARVSVRQGEEGFSGILNWRHGPEADEVEILGPLGQGVARLERGAGGALLVTADGRRHRAEDAESLTEEVLGWRLPLSRLARWVQGRPHPDSEAELERDAEGRPWRLRQDGWRIEYAAWQAVDGAILPGRVVAEGGGLRLKLAVDAWGLP